MSNNEKTAESLSNSDAWMFYRLELCSIAINPPATAITWPIKPEEQWSV